jgi:hypothetical protein
MDERIQEMTRRLEEMIQPYLGKGEYGNLIVMGRTGKLPTWVEKEGIVWYLGYEIFSSTSAIFAEFLIKEGVFQYFELQNHEEVRTESLEVALDYFKQAIANIREQRISSLKAGVEEDKRKGISLEESVAEMRRWAQKEPRFAPTEGEIQLYEKFYKERCVS